jgi:hypothetical protein
MSRSIGVTQKYIWNVPKKIPEGWILFHNRVHAQWDDQAPGVNGFRAWLTKDELSELPLAKPCDCGWSGLLHYRIEPKIARYGPPPNVSGQKMPSYKE